MSAPATNAALLVVSPHPAARRLLQLLLAQAGYIAHTVADGDEALEHMRTQPAVVLVDVRAPDEDTLLLLGLLQRRHPQIPRVLLHDGQARLVLGEREDVLQFGDACTAAVFPTVDELKEVVRSLLIEKQLLMFRPPFGQA